MRSDGIAPLFASGDGAALGMRQGIVRAWDPATARNTVEVAGVLLTDVPILNTSEALLLAPDDVVSILTWGASWGILGRYTVPGTSAAASALNALGAQSNDVTAAESTSSSSYTNLTTVGPSVTAMIGATGRCLVIVGAEIRGVAVAGAAIATGAGYMSYEVTGANARTAVDWPAAYASIRYDATPNSTMELEVDMGASRVSLLTGLTPGATTFTAKYRRSGTSAATFGARNITVLTI